VAAPATAELARQAFEAYRERDLEGLLAIMHPDVRVRSLLTEAERADYHGHQGVREWFAAVFEVFPHWSPRIAEIRELGKAAVVRFEVTATGAGSGVRIEQTYWQGSRLRDGAVEFFGFFRSEQDALECLGLSGRAPGG
jgi:ketosteroid isomerase-like protein